MRRRPAALASVLLAGLLLAACPAARPQAPYPPSDLLAGLTLDWSSYRRLGVGSDQWPMSWAADGALYASFQDGGGLGPEAAVARAAVSIGLARLTGGSAATIAGHNLIGGYAPTVAPCFPRLADDAVDERPGSPCRGQGRAGKSVGILALGPNLHVWISPGSGAEAYREARLYRAPLGRNEWTRADWAFLPTDPRPLLYPAFVQAGRNLADAGEWIYLYAAAFAPLDPDRLTLQRGPAGGAIYLLRARRDADLLARGSYVFFAGLDTAGSPCWSGDPAAKEPVFTDPAGVSAKTSASYVPTLGRFLLTTEHGAIASGAIGVFEAPNPWGPWRTVFYGDLTAGNPALPKTTFLAGFVPSAFAGQDGFTLAFTGRGALDALNLVDGRFVRR